MVKDGPRTVLVRGYSTSYHVTRIPLVRYGSVVGYYGRNTDEES